MNNMITEQQKDELVRRIVDAVHPDKIILFGSRARGTARPDSDLDVMVIVPDGVHRRKAVGTIYRKLLGSGLDADIIVATHDDIETYRDSPYLVYYYALKDGIELYAA